MAPTFDGAFMAEAGHHRRAVFRLGACNPAAISAPATFRSALSRLAAGKSFYTALTPVENTAAKYYPENFSMHTDWRASISTGSGCSTRPAKSGAPALLPQLLSGCLKLRFKRTDIPFL